MTTLYTISDDRTKFCRKAMKANDGVSNPVTTAWMFRNAGDHANAMCDLYLFASSPFRRRFSNACTQKFTSHGDLHTVTLRICHALHRHVEIDRAHDAVSELFVDACFPGRAVDTNEFIKPVNERITRRPQRQQPR